MAGDQEETAGVSTERVRSFFLKKETFFKDRIRFCIMVQYIWYILMMGKLYAESFDDESTFPKITELLYIWDDFLPVLFIYLFSIYHHRLTLTTKYVKLSMIIGYLPLLTSFGSYASDFYQHTEEVGCLWLEKYPYGMFWYTALVVSHILRIISIYNFLYLMLIWMLLERL